MKKSFLLTATVLIIMLMSALTMTAQNPVKWTASATMTSATEGKIVITGQIEKGWHVYGFNQSPDGPQSTSMSMSRPAGLTFTGKLSYSPKLISVMDEVFGVQVTYWENSVTFTRKFNITPGTKGKVGVDITYMACNDSSCMPPKTESLTVEIK